MPYHKLLSRQLKKYSTDELGSNEAFLRFIEVVNDSYAAFDRDKDLSDHAFTVSQQEFNEINERLSGEVELRKLSIAKLKDTLNNIKADTVEHISGDDNDLLEIMDMLNDEIVRRKEVEKKLLEAKEEAEKEE